MKHFAPLASLLLTLALGTLSSVAQADLAPPPGYVEVCTVDRQQKPNERCELCSKSYFREPDGCKKKLASKGFSQRCRSRGASVWTEVWCRPKDSAAPPPSASAAPPPSASAAPPPSASAAPTPSASAVPLPSSSAAPPASVIASPGDPPGSPTALPSASDQPAASPKPQPGGSKAAGGGGLCSIGYMPAGSFAIGLLGLGLVCAWRRRRRALADQSISMR